MQDFLCGVCQELLQRPVSLPCGHLFCLTCICKTQMTCHRCPLCRSLCKIEQFGIVPPLAKLIQDEFPEKHMEREKDEALYIAQLIMYKKYTKTRLIRITNIVRNILRYRPICSYKELQEFVAKKPDMGTSMSLVELKHVLSLSNVHMFQHFCICPAIFVPSQETIIHRSDIFRFAVREFAAECKSKNEPVPFGVGDPLPYHPFMQKCLSEVEMAIAIIEGWGHDTLYMKEWMKVIGADESYYQTMEYVLPELKLDVEPRSITDQDIIQTVTTTFEKMEKLKTHPVDWSDWEDEGDVSMKRETYFSIDYHDIDDTTWMYPNISKSEYWIAKHRSPTIRAKWQRAIKDE